MNMGVRRERTVVIGAGMGGLAAAIRLAGQGHDVVVFDKENAPGGKMRHVAVDGALVDGGPTVFTMKWVFDRLLEGSGQRLKDAVGLKKADLLARHRWTDGSSLDLFADIGKSAEAIEAFSDRANADGYRRFCADSETIFAILKEPFIAGQRPTMARFLWRLGPLSIRRHLTLRPFDTMWSALGDYFSDPRLRQLFARYSTYVGSSPFLTPATLMLIAHVEQEGVWMVDGGMHALAKGLVRLGEARGVRYRFGTGVAEILSENGRVSGVVLDDGERVETRAVVFNGDVSALGAGLAGEAGRAVRPRPVPPAKRSLSAIAVAGTMPVADFPLAHHTVFFGPDYPAEFSAIFDERRIAAQPTVYICAQDRDPHGTVSDAARQAGRERVLMLVNAPADGDTKQYDHNEIDRCLTLTLEQLDRCGLTLDRASLRTEVTTPAGFAKLFPGSGGAIYGRATHGWLASFQRAGARTALKGLYLAGGSVHPGPGVPMATLSGLLAADALVRDHGSMPASRPAAISGGMSTG
ncbi:1-hydroxycarotenoid 3,4-desaturase CrtD [Roseitalea porphyridii]